MVKNSQYQMSSKSGFAKCRYLLSACSQEDGHGEAVIVTNHSNMATPHLIVYSHMWLFWRVILRLSSGEGMDGWWWKEIEKKLL
jgi:hypothetical protein